MYPHRVQLRSVHIYAKRADLTQSNIWGRGHESMNGGFRHCMEPSERGRDGGEIDTSSITGVDKRAANRFTDRPVDSHSDLTDLERGRNHHKRAGRRQDKRYPCLLDVAQHCWKSVGRRSIEVLTYTRCVSDLEHEIQLELGSRRTTLHKSGPSGLD